MSRARWAVVLLACMTLAGLGAGCATQSGSSPSSEGGPADNTAPPASALSHISADTLYNAYKANELAADQAFKGQWLIVDGVVESVGKDVLGTPYVALGSALTVQCMFRPGDEEALVPLRAGQAVSIKGKCDGFLIEVILRDCEVWSRPS